MKEIEIISISNETGSKPEIRVSKETLYRLAREWKYYVFVQKLNKCTYYYLLTPNYIFYARENNEKGELSEEPSALICPRCKSAKVFETNEIWTPSEVKVLKCSNCHGTWISE